MRESENDSIISIENEELVDPESKLEDKPEDDIITTKHMGIMDILYGETGETEKYEEFRYEYEDPTKDDFEIYDNELNAYGLSKNDDGTYKIQESYKNDRYLMDYIWMALMKISEDYSRKRKANNLPLFEIVDKRETCIVLLNGRMNSLADSGRKGSNEYQECAFLRKALANGWTPSDIFFLSEFYEMVDKATNREVKKTGINTIKFIMEMQIQKVEDRLVILNDLVAFNVTAKNEKLNELINVALSSFPLPTEYASDENYAAAFKSNGYLNPNQMMRHGSPSENYLELISSATLYRNLSDKQKQKIRGKKDYVMAEMSDKELEEFKLHSGHRHNGITKSNRQALKEVFGEEVYDDIDEMHRGSDEDRTVNIIHSLGNKYMEKGEEVLEIDFAGSGFKEARREYNGHHGKRFTDGTRNTEDDITSQYGHLVKKPNSNSYYSHLRSKDTEMELANGKKMVKTRYSIAGPTPDLIFKPGMFNLGEYSIENTRIYGKNFAKDFLFKNAEKEISEQRKNGSFRVDKMKDVHIHLTGHSRGAVACGESVKLMNEWVKDFEATNPVMKGYSKKIKYKQILRDPVPGIFTKWFHSSVDLRSVKNLDTTLFCTMAQEHFDVNFPLQNVRGAQRIIIGTTDHGMELGSTDSSQMLKKGDGKAHLAGFYDSETGEYFRGSGLTEIPDGVYIADDNYNLIRITSYSQLGKVIDAVYAGKSKQGRVETIHKMVRNWFLDNSLKMSFVDDEAYHEADAKRAQIAEKIMKSTNKRLAPIKELLEGMNNLNNEFFVTDEVRIRRNNEVIKACREYMEKTRIPTSGEDSTNRMNMVSDLMTFYMRENNRCQANINLQTNEPENELDEKIRKHKARMEEKPGALKRKLGNETKRLERDESILKMMEETRKICQDALEELKETRKNKTPSSSYEAFRNTLNEGLRLDNRNSVNDYKKFLKLLRTTSNNYTEIHTMYGDPSTPDGQKRVEWSDKCLKHAEKYMRSVNTKSKYMPDKDRTMYSIISDRKADIRKLEKKVADIEKKEAAKKAETEKKANNKKLTGLKK